MLGTIGADMAEWAGIPMPLDGMRLIIEPTYPRGKELAAIGAPAEEALPPDVTLRNSWWSSRRNAEIYIWNEGGKVCWAALPRAVHRIDLEIQTLGASVAWGIEQEGNAVQLLGTLLRHHAFKMYLLTGMFLETSARSRVTYLFRKLRPTIALSGAGTRMEGACRALPSSDCLLRGFPSGRDVPDRRCDRSPDADEGG